MKTGKTTRKATNQNVNRQRRLLLGYGAAGLLHLAFPWAVFGRQNPETLKLSSITELPGLVPLETPLLTFRGYETDPDMEIKRRILADMSADSGLASRLDLSPTQDNPVSVHFDSLDTALLFVPEQRSGYAEAYRRYCDAAIELVANRVPIDVPQITVRAPAQDRPDIPSSGITAFIVHQSGKQYRAVCSFSQQDTPLPRQYLFEGAFFSAHLGAIDLKISNPSSGVFKIDRRNYTMWQNRTDSLFNLLATPVEETLHYTVGPYTDKKLTTLLSQRADQRVDDVQKLVNHWLAVEEALVGGAVRVLVPEIAGTFGIDLTADAIRQGLQLQQGPPRYAFRDRGIAAIRKLGLERAMTMYRDDPAVFEKMVC